MVVALTLRQWDNLKAATGTAAAFDDLATALRIDLDLEGVRYEHRQAITQVLKPFFDAREVSDFADLFEQRKVTWSRYRTFGQVVRDDPDCSTDNPMFSMVEQPGIGTYLAPGHPTAFSELERIPPKRAPRLGENTDEILTELGYSDSEIARLHDDGIVAG